MIVQKALTLESNDCEYLKGLNINLSELIRDYMRNVVAAKKGNIDGINIELERMNLAKNLEILSKTQAEIQKSRQIIETFEQNQVKNKEEQLKMEKEKMEKMSKCANCQQPMNEDTKIELKKDVCICKACYHSCDIKRLMK